MQLFKRAGSSKFLRFTMIEMLIVLAIIGILLAMLLPVLGDAKVQAKYVRWLAFNRSCSNDPSCIINFNFQSPGGTDTFSGGPGGDVLINSAAGAESDGFSPQFYNGYLKNKNGGKHNFEWVRAGRYNKFKWALKFNGADTFILVPTTDAVDFTPFGGFTVLCWVKFDKLDLGDCVFSKSLWGTAWDAACQYDLYSNPYSGKYGQGSFDIDVFTTCGTWANTDVDFEKAGWVHLALRYEYFNTDPTTGNANGKIMVFINGKALGDYIDTTEDNPYTGTATEWQACVDNHVPLIIGGAGCYRKYWSPRTYDPNGDSLDNTWLIKFNFQGLMDEFLVYKRALSDAEIRAHYDMGKM
jgi:prepilin-type N-terminal cleavage/methylation domain-containing protein